MGEFRKPPAPKPLTTQDIVNSYRAVFQDIKFNEGLYGEQAKLVFQDGTASKHLGKNRVSVTAPRMEEMFIDFTDKKLNQNPNAKFANSEVTSFISRAEYELTKEFKGTKNELSELQRYWHIFFEDAFGVKVVTPTSKTNPFMMDK